MTSLSYGVAPPRYRLPGATHLGRVVLAVSDLECSLDFYQQVLGLRVLARGDATATLGAHGDDRVLVELRTGDGVKPLARPRLGLYHFAILLPSRAALGAFIRHLAGLHAQAGTADHLVSEALYLQDPDNLGIEVYADRPRSAWRTSGAELAMTSEPLDIASVVAEAGDMPWTGMPAGTVIGHVHLHVGDLDEAAAFYHETLGFDKTVWSYPGALFLAAGGYHHHLGTNTWARGAVPVTAGDARLVEWEILLPSPADVDAVTESLTEHGISADASSQDGAVARDPWGTAVRLRSA